MEKIKSVLNLILIVTIIAIILGTINIILYGTKVKVGKVGGQKIFKEVGSSAVLIKIEGEIHSSKSTLQSTGSDTILEKLREIEDRPDVKGILLEINSPGGTVGASQEIYEELMKLRKTKKIVVSMKDLAASGGYYIASSADYIFAEAGTITGSIGVIAMSPNVGGFLDKWKIKMRVYKAGKYKDMLSMFRNATEEEDSIMQNLLSDTYRRFIKDVAKGRNKKESEVEKFAEGRIFSGEAAVKNKMIDAIGGRREALEKLSELCGNKGTLPLFEEEESPLDRFMQILGSKFSGHTEILNPAGLFVNNKQASPVMIILPNAIGLK